MKRKFVLRLLATVMAATLVVTGVPGTALTGIAVETVYAAISTSTGSPVTAKTQSSFTLAVTANNYYVVVPKATADDTTTFNNTKVKSLNWIKASGSSYTFENLSTYTEYNVYTMTADNYAACDANTLVSAATITKLTGVDTKTSSGDQDFVLTKGIDISGATVELEQTSYTYSVNGITPKVKSITVDGTKIEGSELTRLFGVSLITKDNATVAKSGTASTQATITPKKVDGQKYEGTVSTPAITVTALDLSSESAAAYITKNSDGTQEALDPETVSNPKKTPGTDFYVFAEGDTTTALVNGESGVANKDYYLTYANISAGGTATVTVHGQGNYTGTLTATYELTKGTGSAPTGHVKASPTTTSIVGSIDNWSSGDYEFAISTKENPTSYTWVTATEGKYTFTECDGSALVADQNYYIVARAKATATTNASTVAKASAAVKLATGDLSQATVVLKNGTAVVNDKTYTFTGNDITPTTVVTLGSKTLTTTTDYEVKYAKVVADKTDAEIKATAATDAPKAAGTWRVYIEPKDNSGLCGEKTIDFVINQVTLTATITLGETTKTYDGTNTLTTTAVAYIDKVDGTVPAADSEGTAAIAALATGKTGAAIGKLKLTLSGSTIGAQTVTAVDYSELKLDNYKIEFIGLSNKTVTIQKLDKVTFSGGDQTALTYAYPLTLDVTNNAGLKQTYSVVSGYEDYIAVSDTGVVTVKKYKDGITPQVKVSVKQENTDNYDSTATEPKIITFTTFKQAQVTVAIEPTLLNTSKYVLSVRPDATEAEILKKLNITLTYKVDEVPAHNKVITLDTTNSTVHYASQTVGNVTDTYTKPTVEDTYTVVVTYTGADKDNLSKYTSTDATNGTIELTISKSADSLTDAEDSKVSTAPVISGDKEFTGSTVVTITAGSGATIYYTTDETAPTTASKKYTAAFSITEDTVVKAIAVEDGKTVSTVTTASFTKKVTEDDPEEQLKKAQEELEQAKQDLATAQQAAQKAESDKASAVAEAEKAATAAAEKAAAEKIAAAEKAQKAAEEKQAAAEAAQKKAEAAQKAAEDKAAAATTATTKVGDTVKVDGNTYKVTNVKSKTVSFAKVKKNAKTVNIVSSVEINGVTYKVTSIAASAFKGDKKLTSVTIPSTVKTIGANAFNGCTKLKTITINSSKITKIGSKAFSGVKKTAVVKAPSKKVAAYKKLLKKAKFTGKVKKA